MNTFPQTDINVLDPKEREQIIRTAKEVLRGGNAGILSTIDQSGTPQSRWMATMSFDDFPDLYTLTSARSRKVAQIQSNPVVHWMFSNPELTLVVNLTGKAEIYLHEAEAMKRIWQQIIDRSRAFFLGDSAKGSGGFVVIHTKVEKIECTIPKKVLTFSINPTELSKSFNAAESEAPPV
jgi:general stress protein 26